MIETQSRASGAGSGAERAAGSVRGRDGRWTEWYETVRCCPTGIYFGPVNRPQGDIFLEAGRIVGAWERGLLSGSRPSN